MSPGLLAAKAPFTPVEMKPMLPQLQEPLASLV